MKALASVGQFQLMVLTAIALASLSGCSRTSMGPVMSMCMQPSGTPVNDSHQAILLARAAWHCARPFEDRESESAWLKKYEAQNIDDVWHISRIVPVGFVGGGPGVQIDARDGRVLDMYRTQ